MPQRKLTRNIGLTYLVNFLRGLEFSIPIMTIFLNLYLTNIFQLTIILSFWAIGFIIFEFPSGIIADMWGRKRSIILSNGLAILSIIMISLFQSFPIFIVNALLTALSNALLSGTDTALLYDTTQKLNAETDDNTNDYDESVTEGNRKETVDYEKIAGINRAMWPVGASIGALIGSPLAVISLKLPIMVTLIPFFMALIVSLFLIPVISEQTKSKKLNTHLKDSFKLIFSNRQIKILFIAGFIVYATGEIAHQMNQIYFQFLGIEIKYFGLLFMITYGTSSLGSILSHKLSKHIGNKRLLILGETVSTIISFTMTFFRGLWVGVVLSALSIFWGISWPIKDNFLNKEVESKNRASINSAANFANFLGFALFAPLFGLLIDSAGILTFIRIIQIIGLMTIPFLFLLKEKIIKKS
jgi:MFS family permease